jgi:ABC-type branched-subunit amino acid transport system ATPase component
MLEIRHLKKTFGDLVAVNDVSFTLRPGQLVGLLGPNGAGKTTTVSMITGLIRPDAGEVLVDGAPLAGDTDPKSGASASCRRIRALRGAVGARQPALLRRALRPVRAGADAAIQVR